MCTLCASSRHLSSDLFFPLKTVTTFSKVNKFGCPTDISINRLLFIPNSELSIDHLKRETQITDEWLDQRLEEADLPEVAACFDNTEDYVEKLGLTPGQQTDVMRTQTLLNSTQAGMKVALKHWRNRNPLEATFRALLLILLSLAKGDVAVRVCEYLSKKCE